MKEVTKWDNLPRMMWVWDKGNEAVKCRLLVVYIADSVKSGQRRVCAINTQNNTSDWYDFCAEITKKRMTRQQLSFWLSEKPRREYKDGGGYILPFLGYCKDNADEEVPSFIRIREDGGEWREPLVDCCERVI